MMNKREKASIAGVLESIRIDVLQAENGQLSITEAREALEQRIAHLTAALELDAR